MRAHRSALLALCFLLPACSVQTPTLKAPSLAEMQRDSVDSVNITLGPGALGFLRFLSGFGGGHDPHDAAATNLLRGLHEVQVHNFEFATDHTYKQADLEALRSQLAAPGWQHVVQVRDSSTNEDVDIYCVLDNHTITRLVIVAAEPREFTLVNIDGTIDPDQIGMLRHGFIPHDHDRSNLALTRPDGSDSHEIDEP